MTKQIAGIRFRKGSTDILIIAPHAAVITDKDGNKKYRNDRRTGIIAEELRKQLRCYAIINDSYLKPTDKYPQNLNNYRLDLYKLAQAKKHPEFLDHIKKVADSDGHTMILWIHGMEDSSALGEGQEHIQRKLFVGVPSDLQVLLGYGQGMHPKIASMPKQAAKDQSDSFTANTETAEKFTNFLNKFGLTTLIVRPDAANFRGRDPKRLNQWFVNQNYTFEQVESIQLEIREKDFRDNPKNCRKAAKIIFQALSALVRHPEQDTKPPNENVVQRKAPKAIITAEKDQSNVEAFSAENSPDDTIVDEAYRYLKETFRKHFHNAMVEAGRYIIDTFYDGKEREALAKNKTTDQPPNLKRLIDKIREAPKDPSESVPSIAWFYNAVNLAAHEAICEKEGFQTFRMLGHSHKLQLLTVPKLKKIQKDEFDEAILPAFEVKEKLAKVALDKPFSVREFKDHINRKFPSNQKQNPKTLLKQHEKQLIKMLNQAKEQIQPDGPLARAYEKVLRQVETLLGEIKKAEKKNPKKSSNKSEKQKIQTEDGVEKEAAGGKLLPDLPN